MKHLAKACTSALTFGFLMVAGTAAASAHQVNGNQQQVNSNQDHQQQSSKVVNFNQNTYPLYQGKANQKESVRNDDQDSQQSSSQVTGLKKVHVHHVTRTNQGLDNDDSANASAKTYYYRGNIYNTKGSYRAARFANSKIGRLAKSKLGDPYVWGGSGANAFDCSGFTQYLYRNAKHINIPRTAQAQYDYEKHVSYKHIKPGNLVFFGAAPTAIAHVGMYIGNGLMIDAQNRGVIIEDVKAPWWNLVGCAKVRRHLDLD